MQMLLDYLCLLLSTIVSFIHVRVMSSNCKIYIINQPTRGGYRLPNYAYSKKHKSKGVLTDWVYLQLRLEQRGIASVCF